MKYPISTFFAAVAGTIAGIFTIPGRPSNAKRLTRIEKDMHELLAFRNGQIEYDRKLRDTMLTYKEAIEDLRRIK